MSSESQVWMGPGGYNAWARSPGNVFMRKEMKYPLRTTIDTYNNLLLVFVLKMTPGATPVACEVDFHDLTTGAYLYTSVLPIKIRVGAHIDSPTLGDVVVINGGSNDQGVHAEFLGIYADYATRNFQIFLRNTTRTISALGNEIRSTVVEFPYDVEQFSEYSGEGMFINTISIEPNNGSIPVYTGLLCMKKGHWFFITDQRFDTGYTIRKFNCDTREMKSAETSQGYPGFPYIFGCQNGELGARGTLGLSQTPKFSPLEHSDIIVTNTYEISTYQQRAWLFIYDVFDWLDGVPQEITQAYNTSTRPFRNLGKLITQSDHFIADEFVLEGNTYTQSSIIRTSFGGMATRETLKTNAMLQLSISRSFTSENTARSNNIIQVGDEDYYFYMPYTGNLYTSQPRELWLTNFDTVDVKMPIIISDGMPSEFGWGPPELITYAWRATGLVETGSHADYANFLATVFIADGFLYWSQFVEGKHRVYRMDVNAVNKAQIYP